MNYKISELQNRYGLASKQTVYDRIKALHIERAGRGEISSESVDELDKFDKFLKNNPGATLSDFPRNPEAITTSKLDLSNGQLDLSNGQLDLSSKQLDFNETLVLIEAIARHFKPDTDPLAKYKALEYAVKHKLILPSSEIQRLIGVNPCKYGKIFQRGSFIFKKSEKIGRQTGWLIEQQ
jgi:hypothetical protein